MLLPLSIRQAKDASHDLFNSRRRSRFPEAAKHISKWTIPAFTQLLHRDDEPDRAFCRSDVLHVLQLIEGSDGNLYVVFSNAKFSRQTVSKRLACIHSLCLEQHDRPQIFTCLLRFRYRNLLEVGTKCNGIGKQLVFLAWMSGNHAERQLHHIRRFQFCCRYLMKHV